MNTLNLFDHGYVAIICLVFVWAVTRAQPKLANRVFSTKEKIEMYWSQSIFLYGIALIAVLIWWFSGRPLADLGFQMPSAENQWMYWSLTGLFFVAYVSGAASTIFNPKKLTKARENWRRNTPFMPATRQEMKPAMHMALCAGITEEIVFRGFLINYFSRLFSGSSLQEIPWNSWPVIAAILIPAVIFGLSHLYLKWIAVFKIVLLATIFGVIFVASKSLLIVVLLHAFIDVVASLMSPTMFRGDEHAEMQDSKIASD